MSVMVCKQIYIESHRAEMLKKAVMQSGLTETEIIQRALDLWEESNEKNRVREAWEATRAFIAERIAQGPVNKGRTWTREDIYEERFNHNDRNSG